MMPERSANNCLLLQRSVNHHGPKPLGINHPWHRAWLSLEATQSSKKLTEVLFSLPHLAWTNNVEAQSTFVTDRFHWLDYFWHFWGIAINRSTFVLETQSRLYFWHRCPLHATLLTWPVVWCMLAYTGYQNIQRAASCTKEQNRPVTTPCIETRQHSHVILWVSVGHYICGEGLCSKGRGPWVALLN